MRRGLACVEVTSGRMTLLGPMVLVVCVCSKRKSFLKWRNIVVSAKAKRLLASLKQVRSAQSGDTHSAVSVSQCLIT